MCGIFGIALEDRSAFQCDDFLHDLKELYKLSMLRGQDATGLALNNGKTIEILKRTRRPSDFISEKAFVELIEKDFENNKGFLSVIGHCRLVTNGSLAVEENNQPIETSKLVGVHNGIIVNANSLNEGKIHTHDEGRPLNFNLESGLVSSDTRQLIHHMNIIYSENNLDMNESIYQTYKHIEGTASIALMSNHESNLYLATNNGSMHYFFDKKNKVFVFSSESFFLKEFVKSSRLLLRKNIDSITKVHANQYISLSLEKLELVTRDIKTDNIVSESKYQKPIEIKTIRKTANDISRCSNCILPASYPGIRFNEKGMCNFCEKHENQKEHGEHALEALLDKYRRNDGSYDCLVGISGGRDSSYGMHMLKTKYGMNPLAYTYDWGLTTDQSRINTAKICGQLGIEHIFRAPDIAKKRRHIRKNIYAWLRKPEMGMVPLFMAGDKDFYHFGRELRKQYDIDLTVFCSGSLLEQRQFFVGFCGVYEMVTNTARLYNYRLAIKLRLASYYAYQYLTNVAYLNESLIDSVRSFFTSFLASDDFLYLYEYLPWNEKEIERVLSKEYNWQADSSYGKNQWRMGDGQTAFTNYIFYTVAGFSEFDNFRSNQIREGLISRSEALELVEQDNKPKWAALQYFASVVGINLDEILARINNIPKLY